MSNIMAIDEPKISDILQKLIFRKGLSVSELARRINLPQPTIQRITSGTHSRPHKKTLEIIANYFGITIDQLRGFEPIPYFLDKIVIHQIPIIPLIDVFNWPLYDNTKSQKIIVDIEISNQSYALTMPDESMEPVIPKGSLLIIDPDKKPHYRSFVVVKIENYPEAIIRQLIIDGNNYYIKSLSPTHEQFKLIHLSGNDSIKGIIVQIRLNCEK